MMLPALQTPHRDRPARLCRRPAANDFGRKQCLVTSLFRVDGLFGAGFHFILAAPAQG
jgi:hypothetical protein